MCVCVCVCACVLQERGKRQDGEDEYLLKDKAGDINLIFLTLYKSNKKTKTKHELIPMTSIFFVSESDIA